MGGFDKTRPQMEGRRDDFVDTQRFQREGDAYDVDDGVGRPHLVKVYVVGRNAVYGPFGLGQLGKDRLGPEPHPLRECRAVQQVPNFPVRPGRNTVVMMLVIMVMVMVIMVVVIVGTVAIILLMGIVIVVTVTMVVLMVFLIVMTVTVAVRLIIEILVMRPTRMRVPRMMAMLGVGLEMVLPRLVGLSSVDRDDELFGGNPAALGWNQLDFPSLRECEGVQALLDIRERCSQIQQSRQQHIPGDAGGTVQIEQAQSVHLGLVWPNSSLIERGDLHRSGPSTVHVAPACRRASALACGRTMRTVRTDGRLFCCFVVSPCSRAGVRSCCRPVRLCALWPA